MNSNDLDEQILNAIAAGSTTREKLMRIDKLRLQTWAVIGLRLGVLTARGALIASKAGWRVA